MKGERKGVEGASVEEVLPYARMHPLSKRSYGGRLEGKERLGDGDFVYGSPHAGRHRSPWRLQRASQPLHRAPYEPSGPGSPSLASPQRKQPDLSSEAGRQAGAKEPHIP